MGEDQAGILREKILSLVEEYASLAHGPKPFVPGKTSVQVYGKVYGAKEMRYLVDSSVDFWLTTGRFNDAFEKKLAALATPNFAPSWFGSPITLREESGIECVDLLKYLDQNKIGSRLLFTGNLTRQPYFEDRPYWVSDEFVNTDIVMNQTFWTGS